MDLAEAKQIADGLVEGKTMEELGASEVLTIKGGFDAKPFPPPEALQDAYEMEDTIVAYGKFGDMPSLKIISHDVSDDGKNIIKQWYDVTDEGQKFDLTEDTFTVDSYEDFLETVLQFMKTEVPVVGGERKTEYSIMEDELKIGLGFAVVGGGGGAKKAPFVMPKPINFRLGFPIKKEIKERVKALD